MEKLVEESSGAQVNRADGDVERIVQNRYVIQRVSPQRKSQEPVEAVRTGIKSTRKDLGYGRGGHLGHHTSGVQQRDSHGNGISAAIAKLDHRSSDYVRAPRGFSSQLRRA